jgi:hypothetical protein
LRRIDDDSRQRHRRPQQPGKVETRHEPVADTCNVGGDPAAVGQCQACAVGAAHADTEPHVDLAQTAPERQRLPPVVGVAREGSQQLRHLSPWVAFDDGAHVRTGGAQVSCHGEQERA